MIIDSSYFIGEINIPNTSKSEIQYELNHFIAKYESDLLNHLLGNPLYYLFVQDGLLPPEQQDPRFQLLLNGTVYNDVSYWRGLRYTYDGQTWHSLIAYYTYWYWLKDKSSWNSGVGNVRPQGDKSDPISPALKMVNSWNTFSEQVNEFIRYMNYAYETYPEWEPVDLWKYQSTNDFDI